MSGRILIIDTVATNRIVMKVKLLAAKYDVIACANQAEGLATFTEKRPDLVLLNLSDPSEDNHKFCSRLSSTPDTADIAIIGVGVADTARARFAALDAGANDVLPHPVNDGLLLARIRNLMRMRHTPAELWMRSGTQRALGFEETHSSFDKPAQIAIITEDTLASTAIMTRLNRVSQQKVQVQTIAEALTTAGDAPDVLILDSTTFEHPRADLFRLVADLRARDRSRLVPLMIILPPTAVEDAAMALDLGADDVVTGAICSDELRLRCDMLIKRKRQQDRLRNKVHDGLVAAITDPLTGLYNRRYATPYLIEIAKQSKKTGQDFAIMMIDIDHFKQINDRFGHQAGDAVLVALADRLRSNLRAIDLIARVGGEEFLVALPHCTVEQAQLAASRLCQLVNHMPFDVGRGIDPIGVTISVGVAVRCAESADMICADDMCHQADGALYAAKSAGRDRVSLVHSAA